MRFVTLALLVLPPKARWQSLAPCAPSKAVESRSSLPSAGLCGYTVTASTTVYPWDSTPSQSPAAGESCCFSKLNLKGQAKLFFPSFCAGKLLNSIKKKKLVWYWMHLCLHLLVAFVRISLCWEPSVGLREMAYASIPTKWPGNRVQRYCVKGKRLAHLPVGIKLPLLV